MKTISETFAIALQQCQAGHLTESQQLCRLILQQQPTHLESLNLCGAIAYQLHRFEEAIAYYQQILALNPNLANVHNNLGAVLKEQGQLDQAIAHYRQALSLNPNYPEAHNNLGNALKAQGKLDEAIAHYQQALKLNPHFSDVYNSLGVILKEQGKLSAAIAHYQQVLNFKPNCPDAYNNLGNALKEQGKLSAAITHYKLALKFSPNYPAVHFNLGNALKEQGQMEQAIAHYQLALKFKPNYPDALVNLGNALLVKSQLDEAIAHYQQALKFQPNYPDAHNNLGKALREQGKVDEAIAHYRQAITLEPNLSMSHSNLLLALHYNPNHSPETIFAEHQVWARRHAAPLAATIQPYANQPHPHRRLRVGYVSPDFCTHSVAFFIEPVLKAHDKTQFEVFCYAHVARPDQTTQRLQQQADCWRHIWGMSEQQLAELIRTDGIDILVDLTGHTGNNRMLLFARKPAPIQVTYLGYPNTTGLTTVDYRITDAFADPPQTTPTLYTEELIRLPASFLCYQPIADAPQVCPPPVLDNGYITFGCFNNLAKIAPQVIACWSRILQAVPNSHLILKYKGLTDPGTQHRFLDLFQQHGISVQSSPRVTLLGRVPGRVEHLATYNRIDIALDTFPYNGTTTTCEALWMGVPVIGMSGQTHVSRVGVSLLSNLGLVELIAGSPEEYVACAVRLAKDIERLQQLRASGRVRMATSTLTDAVSFTRALEDAYHQMWQRWCSSTKN